MSKRLAEAESKVVELSIEHPELGADKVGRMVRNSGHRISSQRVRNVRREECLQVPPPRKKKRRLGESTGRHPQKAIRKNHVWSWDFVHDTTLKGGSIRILSLVDEFTREVYALHVDRHIGANKLIEVLGKVISQHGSPAYIRSDNGPEFIAKALQQWLARTNIKTLYIAPASPWQNGYVESFHDKFRRECLNREIFYTLTEARVIIEQWRLKFNCIRPHRSLQMCTPEEYAIKSTSEGEAIQHNSSASVYDFRSAVMLTKAVREAYKDLELLTYLGP